MAGRLAYALQLWPSHTVTGVWGDGMACVSAGKAAEEFAKVGIVECMAFSSDGRFLGVSTADGALAIFDWHTGRPLNVLRSAAASVHYSSPSHVYVLQACAAQNQGCFLIQRDLSCKAMLMACRAEHGVDSTIRDLDFSPAHQDKVRSAPLIWLCFSCARQAQGCCCKALTLCHVSVYE